MTLEIMRYKDKILSVCLCFSYQTFVHSTVIKTMSDLFVGVRGMKATLPVSLNRMDCVCHYEDLSSLYRDVNH